MAIFNYSTIFSQGLAANSFDIAQGPANTDIIDVLLSVGAGVLTSDAPFVLVSTGALGGARTLDISALESESSTLGAQALPGRFFYLSVQNSDISTNNITVNSSSTINGSATFVIASTGDYMFYHVASGVWRVNQLPRPEEPLATIIRLPFASTKWDEGATKNQIKIIPSGTPGTGEIGPHGLQVYGSYVVQVINTDFTLDEKVNVEIQFDSSGNIYLKKGGGQDFSGVVIIVGSMD